MIYNLYTDKPNKFNCNIEIEGTSLAKSKVRLVVETDEMTYNSASRILSQISCSTVR